MLRQAALLRSSGRRLALFLPPTATRTVVANGSLPLPLATAAKGLDAIGSDTTTATTTTTTIRCLTYEGKSDFTTKASSAHKRALSKRQLAGEKQSPAPTLPHDSAPASSSSAPAPAASDAAAASSTAPAGGGSAAPTGGGGGGGLIAVLGLAAVGAGAAYYLDVDVMGKVRELTGGGGAQEKEATPESGTGSESESEGSEAEAQAQAQAPQAEKPVDLAEKDAEKEKEKELAAATDATDEKEAESERALDISAAVEDEAARPSPEIPSAPASGDREKEAQEEEQEEAQVEKRQDNEAPAADVIEIEPLVAKEDEGDEEEDSVAAAAVSHAAVSAEAAALELKVESESVTEGELRSVHRSLRANVNEAYLSDLERLSPGEIKVRLVQLAAEMEERTRWEAVRLKEFLAMKEKETADKYLEILQKQRLEFEDLVARRLREQEDALARQASAALRAKEDAIQSVLSASADALKAEHDAEMASAADRIDREARAKYESEFGAILADAKAAFARELEEKVTAVQHLSERLADLEAKLEVSRSFESGSQRAHRLSAAALALAGRMEAGKGAAEELAALRMAVGNDGGVIGAAVLRLPSSVKEGVPTLPELQTSFDHVYSVCRQAAHVPKGRSGLGAQILGMTFASLTIPPSPDTAEGTTTDDGGDGDGSSADYVLSRARRYVNLGELHRAVEELNKLDGQAAFAAKDWKKAASDRVAVDKALGVIKLECAILNQNMSGSKS